MNTFAQSRVTVPVGVALFLLPWSAQGSPACKDFGEAAIQTQLQSAELTESSGLAFSRQHPGVLWTHNDSGDGPVIYAFNLEGASQGQVTFADVTATDWEALGLGPCGETDCLFVGDIGDNLAARSHITIWRVEEPVPPGLGETVTVRPQGLDVVYPDGAQDAEGLAVDPQTGDLFIFEKRFGRLVSVYRVPAAAWDEPQGWVEAEFLTRLSLEGGTEALLVTQADIEPTGSELFLGTYGAGYRFEIRRRQNQVVDLGSPQPGPIFGDGQCEAASYSSDGLSLYFTCEASPTPLARSDCQQRRQSQATASQPKEPMKAPNEGAGCHCGFSPLTTGFAALATAGMFRRRRPRSKPVACSTRRGHLSSPEET